jgi:hypothetical protein
MIRKHDRNLWKKELNKEYAFFTERDYRKNLKSLGGRVLYTAKQWDDKYIAENYDGQFNLYNEDGGPLGYPPTSIGVLVKKINSQQSLRLSERRRSKKPSGGLQISTMRNKDNGELIDIVSRAEASADILPYRVDPSGKSIKIYLHEGNPRGLTNAVPRGTCNLDGRYWSGHMIEAISIKADDIPESGLEDGSVAKAFADKFLGLNTFYGSKLEKGAGYYTDPKHIDEKIDTYYIEVSESSKKTQPVSDLLMDSNHYKTRGLLREIDAQDILNAISVGLIATCRLEIQIRNLLEKYNITATSWSECPLQLRENPNLEETKICDLIKRLKADTEQPYEKAKGSAGQIQLAHSVFVDEGLADSGGSSGLSSHEMDFFIPSDQATNMAVILPLSKSISGEVMAGVCTDYMPVPQRFKGSGLSVSLPSFELPNDLKSMDEAKRYIAKKFEVDPKYVCQMGPSYFKHIGITPQRVFPFAVSTGPGSVGHVAGATEFVMMKGLLSLCYWDNHDSFIQVVLMAYQQFCQDSDLSVNWSLSKSFAADNSRSISEMGEFVNQGANHEQSRPAAPAGASIEASSSSEAIISAASAAALSRTEGEAPKSDTVTLRPSNTDTSSTTAPQAQKSAPPAEHAAKKKPARSERGGLFARLKGRSADMDQVKNAVKSQGLASHEASDTNSGKHHMKRHID